MPLTLDKVLEVVRAHTALSPDEVREMRERAAAPEYWRSLCDWMSIGTDRGPESGDFSSTRLRDAMSDYQQYGHCAMHEAFPSKTVEALRRAVTRVNDAGWPMVFAFLYDQLWLVSQSPTFDRFATALLGARYQPTISFWVNYVPPVRGNSGFPPHFDNVRPGYHSVTCWLPLTPSTVENGCVYVVERDAIGGDTSSLLEPLLPLKQVQKALMHVRALPANPGSFLAWPHDTLHWGGMFMRGQGRLALSYHLASADFENIDRDLPMALVPGEPLPSFERRLEWVCRSMLRFRGRDPMLERFVAVAQYFAPNERIGWSK